MSVGMNVVSTSSHWISMKFCTGNYTKILSVVI